MKINGLSEKLDSLANKVEKNKRRKQIADDNGESLEYLLDIPVIGGLAFILAMFFRGKRVLREIKLKQDAGNQIKNVIKDTNMVKKAIRNQLNYLMENYKIKEIEIPPENLAEFLDVLKEFPTITATQIRGKENEFVLVVSGEVLS